TRAVSGVATEIPFFSTVTGLAADRIDAAYLADNVRSPVRFAAAIDSALSHGFTRFIEVGSHPALGRGILELAENRGVEAGITFCLHRERDPRATTLGVVAQAYGWGAEIDWSAVYPGARPATAVPPCPWQHVDYWLPGAPDLR